MPKVGNAHRSSANVTKPSTPPPLTSIGAKSARRIRSGAITLDARLDLHGMRQSEAQAALRSFLFRCYAQEQKWVLVITGKGDRPGRERDTYEQEDYGYGVERGVLRRRVPQWLAEPDVRRIVVSYTTAAPHHGGGGALYVELRKKR